MYARLIQVTAKPGQLRECLSTLVDRGLPVLRQQQGFVDAFALTSDTERDKLVGITIWKSKDDAEKYGNGQGRQVIDSLRPLVQQEPTFGSFNLEVSTTHNIGLARAASQR